MNELPCGERLVRCLSGGDIDRVPFGVNLGWHPWYETFVNWRRETGRPDHDVAHEFGYPVKTPAGWEELRDTRYRLDNLDLCVLAGRAKLVLGYGYR